MMNYRNARYNQHGTIDVEIEHPVLGVIPFTASPNDPEKHGREIYAALVEIAQPFEAPPNQGE